MLAFLHVLEDLSDLVKCLRFENIAKLLVLNDSSDSRKCCDLRICCFALKRFEKVKVIYAIKIGKTQTPAPENSAVKILRTSLQ